MNKIYLDDVQPTEVKLLLAEDRFYNLISPLSARSSWDERANRKHKELMMSYYDLKAEYVIKLEALIYRETEKER